MSQPAIALEGVSKSFGGQPALDALSLRLAAGEFAVLLGPNGAGKTTLSRIVSGLIRPDAGAVMIGGIDARKRPAAALARLGVLFQEPTLDLERSARRNLEFHAALHGLPRWLARVRIEEELERVGLADVAGRLVRELSGGNRRRVELARVFLHRPPALLLDEPTAGLDPASRLDLLRRVRGLCVQEGAAALWATHLVEEAGAADRVLLLHQGQLIADASPRELLRRAGTADLNDAFLVLTGAATLRAAE